MLRSTAPGCDCFDQRTVIRSRRENSLGSVPQFLRSLYHTTTCRHQRRRAEKVAEFGAEIAVEGLEELNACRRVKVDPAIVPAGQEFGPFLA